MEVISNLEKREAAKKKRVDLEGRGHPGMEAHGVC